jgi:CzcA family heavy metal efflux pump
MVDALIRWSLRNRAAVLAVALALLVLGTVRAARLPVDVFPDLTAPTVTVITEAHGMAPLEVERLVTYPIESALNGAAGVRRVRSTSSIGISIVWCEFGWESDVYTGRQIVAERLSLVAERLPAEVEAPVLAPVTSIMGEILFLGLTSEQRGGIELRTLADTVVRRRLLALPGVAQVTPIGGARKQYEVRLDPLRLRAHGLSMLAVAEALERANENVSAGFVQRGGVELLVQGQGRLRGIDDIGATVVAAYEGTPVRVRDLGEVRVGGAPRRGSASVDGRAGIVLGVQKQPAANTLALTEQLERVLDELESELPPDVALERDLFRQADFIRVAVENVAEALRDGALLVVLIVLAFLASVRATLITLTAIPLSLVVCVLVLDAFGATINTMTLGGMAIAIGALVDDAVIDVENVVRRLRENAARPPQQRRPALPVVLDASIEIRSSIVFATLIIALVFLPLFFLGAVEGRLLRPLGTAYVVALLASLFVAVTVTPALCHLLLPHSRAVRAAREPALVRWLKVPYAALLRPLLRRPALVVAPALLLLALAVLGAGRFGLAFLPEFNEGSLTINLDTLPGTSLEESEQLGRVADEVLLAQPEVVAISRRTGRAELDEHALGVESSEYEVSLREGGRRRAELLAGLRAELAVLPGTSVTIGQPISHRIDHMLSGTRKSIAVKLFGPDLLGLRDLAREVRDAMEGVAGVADLAIEPQADVPLLRVRFDRESIARHGVPIRDVAHALEAAYQGHAVTTILESSYAYEVVLRIGGELPDPVGLADLPITAPSGATLQIGDLAEIRRDFGPNSIGREAVERKLVVSCNVAGRDVGSVVADCRERVDPLVEAAPGYRVEYGGQFESAIEAERTLGILGVFVILGIGFLLHLAFRSARDAFLVMVNLPLALIGGVLGVYVDGGVLSVASLIGFITVFGIATRNGIMLVSHVRHLQLEEGVRDFREAVERGALERLAPILMTALATMLALIPLALSGDAAGNEIQRPMAIVILFGLGSSMVLNMIVVPVLVLRFGRPAAPVEAGA